MPLEETQFAARRELARALECAKGNRSQVIFAQTIGINPSLLSRILSGGYGFSRWTGHLIAQALPELTSLVDACFDHAPADRRSA